MSLTTFIMGRIGGLRGPKGDTGPAGSVESHSGEAFTAANGNGTSGGATIAAKYTSGAGATDIGSELIKSGSAPWGQIVWQNGVGGAWTLMADGTHEDTAGELTRIDDNGSVLTSKWMVISGTYTTNGYAWNDRRYLKTYQLASASLSDNSDARPSMLSIFADVETCLEMRPAAGHFTGALLDVDHGWEVTSFDDAGGLCAGPGGPTGRDDLDTKLARIGANTMGMAEGGFRPGASYTKAGLVAAGITPYDVEPFTILRIIDGNDGDGLYVSDGATFKKVQLGATDAGVPVTGFGWTSQFSYNPAGGAITETSDRTFELTTPGTPNAWVNAAYSLEKITGDQEISFVLLSTGKLLALGVNSGTQNSATISGADNLRIDYGVLISDADVLFKLVAGVLTNIQRHGTPLVLSPGDKVTLRFVGTVMSILVNDGHGDLVVAAVSGVPTATAYWAELAFNFANGKIGHFRHRAI